MSLQGQIVVLAALHQELEARIKAAEAEVVKDKAITTDIVRVDLPELLREAETLDLTLTDGTKIKLVEKITASITEERRPEAHAWLTEHNFGGIIKTVVIVEFAAKDREAAVALGEELNVKYPGAVEVTERVHHTTLNAFAAERLEEGEPLPEKLFGIFQYSEAKPKPPKAKR